MTSPIAVWEAAIALARPDKLGLPVESADALLMRFLDDRGIVICELPEARVMLALALDAARRFRSGPNRLNLADCFHYACARTYQVPMLSTAGEFRFTDIETVA